MARIFPAPSLASPRRPRSIGSDAPLLPPPSCAASPQANPEDYLRRMQSICEANQQQLELLQAQWEILPDVTAMRRHALLQRKQLRLLQEVQSQLQDFTPPCHARRVMVVAAGLFRSELLRRFGHWHLRLVDDVPGNAVQSLQAQLKHFRPQLVLHLGSDVATCIAVSSACDLCDVFLLHLSSERVFDGESAPYAVDAEPRPVDEEGQRALLAEQQVLSRRRASVLRVPMRSLYGPGASHVMRHSMFDAFGAFWSLCEVWCKSFKKARETLRPKLSTPPSRMMWPWSSWP